MFPKYQKKEIKQDYVLYLKGVTILQECDKCHIWCNYGLKNDEFYKFTEKTNKTEIDKIKIFIDLG